MVDIRVEIEKVGDDRFEVELYEGDKKDVYLVTLDPEFVKQAGLDSGEVIKRTFEFLLKREPKSSILFSFTIPDTVNKYFPEFQEEIVGNQKPE
jgi:hypothetical protein